LKHDNDDIHAITDPGKLAEEVVERKNTIEDYTMQLEEMEKQARESLTRLQSFGAV